MGSSEEFKEGWRAAEDGLDMIDNPFGADTDEEAVDHQEWLDGWLAFQDGKNIHGQAQ